MQRWLIWGAEPLSTPPFQQRKLGENYRVRAMIRLIGDVFSNPAEATKVIEIGLLLTFFHS
ncbi:hypothetical protein MITS9504_02697 [Synechococcus sp. MIT S9504]|nr:hypothetical protein MITS9504_02697 [Synechococcus sp. MIT S9504]